MKQLRFELLLFQIILFTTIKSYNGVKSKVRFEQGLSDETLYMGGGKKPLITMLQVL